MPHLSPMSWIVSIISFWLILMTLTSNIWWNMLFLFDSNIKYSDKYKISIWNWLLQDGW